jgi:hypothetical protein
VGRPDLAPGLQLLQDTQAVIKRAFFEDLYIIRQQLKSHISATEQMQRDQQRGIMLAPLKRQETEWFTPQTERELDLMAEMGMLNDMPQELKDGGGLYQTIYENPLSRARKAEQAGGFYQMLAGVAPLIQMDPENNAKEFLQSFPFERVLKGLAEIHGVPEAWARATTRSRSRRPMRRPAEAGERAGGRHAGVGNRQEPRQRGTGSAAGERRQCLSLAQDSAAAIARGGSGVKAQLRRMIDRMQSRHQLAKRGVLRRRRRADARAAEWLRRLARDNYVEGGGFDRDPYQPCFQRRARALALEILSSTRIDAERLGALTKMERET